MSRIKLEEHGDKLVAGGVLNENQKSALASVTPTAEDILSNIEQYNKQIESMNLEQEMPQKTLPETKAKVTSSKPVRSKRRSRTKQKFDASNRVKPPVKQEENTTMEKIMNFDQELEQMSQTLDNTTTDTNTTTEDTDTTTTEQTGYVGPDMKSQILELLKGRSDAPTQKHINAW